MSKAHESIKMNLADHLRKIDASLTVPLMLYVDFLGEFIPYTDYVIVGMSDGGWTEGGLRDSVRYEYRTKKKPQGCTSGFEAELIDQNGIALKLKAQWCYERMSEEQKAASGAAADAAGMDEEDDQPPSYFAAAGYR